ncbi:MAG: DNA mismatch repair endonuclease MutL [Calditrichaeota bacterium]|nr:DNA mismatch repair endonuclease MutL [Calditrichota bacterium]
MSNKKPKIQILPENLANKIAAGEVVERPSSVVKELVENAIDAEADHIKIIIEQGGKKLIQVIDNGTGMSEEDLPLAFERHATSKIYSQNDLERIETLGFRGEALPSIASVSQIELKSRRAEDKMATVYFLDGGKNARIKKAAANVGTSVAVRNLFFNVPARRQFLRSDNAEIQQILNVLKRFFLAYPNIAFELTIDSREIYDLKISELGERVRSVLGNSIFQGLIPISASLGGIELKGFVSRPDVVRRSRGFQFLFLNGRPIQDRALNHAIFQAYGNLISGGEYPIFCIFLEMDPGMADVNVHPAKMEVRFSNERSLYYFVINTVRKALNDEGVIPEFSSAPEGSALQQSVDQPARPRQIIDEMRHRKRYLGRYGGAQLSLTYFATDPHEPEKKETEPSAEKTPTSSPDIGPVRRTQEELADVQFWQLHNRYIVSEIKSGMVIIDQHVAHERILFERILKVLKKKGQGYGQKLLFPQKISLNYDDFMVFKEIHDVLNKIGFSIKVFSGTTIVIEAMPSDVKVGRESQILLDIIDYYKNEPLTDFDHLEKVAAAYACKNAVKSGEKLSANEMQNLVDQLFACETPFFCPHGRPVIVTIDLEELDRKFKRLS